MLQRALKMHNRIVGVDNQSFYGWGKCRKALHHRAHTNQIFTGSVGNITRHVPHNEYRPLSNKSITYNLNHHE